MLSHCCYSCRWGETSLSCSHCSSRGSYLSMESRGGMILQRKTEKTQTETCPISTLSTYLAWPDRGINPGLHGVRPATNCLSHGMAYNAIIPNCHFHIFHYYFGSNVLDEKLFCVKCLYSTKFCLSAILRIAKACHFL
jgi:hypothetical protein